MSFNYIINHMLFFFNTFLTLKAKKMLLKAN
nr:MAG TPA: hypothetical protein [Caudoviricetes sp.]